jgi:hypothetical protein
VSSASAPPPLSPDATDLPEHQSSSSFPFHSSTYCLKQYRRQLRPTPYFLVPPSTFDLYYLPTSLYPPPPAPTRSGPASGTATHDSSPHSTGRADRLLAFEVTRLRNVVGLVSRLNYSTPTPLGTSPLNSVSPIAQLGGLGDAATT